MNNEHIVRSWYHSYQQAIFLVTKAFDSSRFIRSRDFFNLADLAADNRHFRMNSETLHIIRSSHLQFCCIYICIIKRYQTIPIINLAVDKSSAYWQALA